MKIAILMSAYNGHNYISEQINTILNQTCENDIDLFIRDDGSSDETLNDVFKYSGDPRVHIITGTNLGPAFSFLSMIYSITGYDYYAFADQDDYWMEDKLEKGIKRLLAYFDMPALYFSNAVLVDKNLNQLGRNVYKKEPKRDFRSLSIAGGLLGCTMVFNEKLAKIIQSKPVNSGVIMHDYYIALICSLFNGMILYDEAPSMLYRQHNNNVVGVDYGFLNTVKSRINAILNKSKVSISKQAETILTEYGNDLGKDQVLWLRKIVSYNENINNRLSIAMSRKIRFASLNMSLKFRIALLFGNC